MKKIVLKFKTIVLSDVHLGAPDCSISEVNHFLKHSYSPKLILNGDIIDCWSLKRKGGWTKEHTRFIRIVLKKLEKHDTEVIYLRGNHDDIVSDFLPVSLDKLTLTDKYTHKSSNRNYLCLHGDIFDVVTQHNKWLAVAGDIGYQSLLKLNRYYNKYRKILGKKPFSLSKAIKAKVKSAVNYISRFEENVAIICKEHKCGGFICGHIHTPDNKMIGGVHYLNSGDWVESNTALVEYENGEWEVLEYEEFCERLKEKSIIRDLNTHNFEGEPLPIEEEPENSIAFPEEGDEQHTTFQSKLQSL